MGLPPRPALLFYFGLFAATLWLGPGCVTARAAAPDPTATVSLPDAPMPVSVQRERLDPAFATDSGAEERDGGGSSSSDEASAVAELEPAFNFALSSSSVPVQTGPDQPATAMSQREIDLACQAGTLHGKSCRASWGPILWEFLEATAVENGGNIGLDDETRHDLAGNPFISTWFKCVRQFRYDQWRDDDNFNVDYVAHGMQGGIIGASFEQHSPTGRGLVYVNNGNYWRSRLKGMAWIAVYEVQWKIGPASEASIGNSGLNTYFTPRVQGRSTNETGFQDFVDTPIVGFGWNVGEDAIDRFIMPHVWRHTHNKWALTAYSVLTPCKAVANVLRFKPFYYRDFDLPPVH